MTLLQFGLPVRCQATFGEILDINENWYGDKRHSWTRLFLNYLLNILRTSLFFDHVNPFCLDEYEHREQGISTISFAPHDELHNASHPLFLDSRCYYTSSSCQNEGNWCTPYTQRGPLLTRSDPSSILSRDSLDFINLSHFPLEVLDHHFIVHFVFSAPPSALRPSILSLFRSLSISLSLSLVEFLIMSIPHHHLPNNNDDDDDHAKDRVVHWILEDENDDQDDHAFVRVHAEPTLTTTRSVSPLPFPTRLDTKDSSLTTTTITTDDTTTTTPPKHHNNNNKTITKKKGMQLNPHQHILLLVKISLLHVSRVVAADPSRRGWMQRVQCAIRQCIAASTTSKTKHKQPLAKRVQDCLRQELGCHHWRTTQSLFQTYCTSRGLTLLET